MNIPILNVYYLLCYAWGHARETDSVPTEIAGSTDLPDLFALVLAEGVARVLRRGLDRDYVDLEETVSGVKGKLDLDTTLKRLLLSQAKTHCRFQELQYDVPQNRILKATLRDLHRIESLDESIRARVARVYRKLDAVSDERITRRDFRTVQLHRNNRLYDFLLSVCRLVHDQLIVDERTGRARFRDFRRDEAVMWKVFEDFVLNFLRQEQRVYQVTGQATVRWHEAWSAEASDLEKLPFMRLDVLLEGADRRIILDTKFVLQALGGRFEKRTLPSEHLYQLFAYLENRQAAKLSGPQHEGMLLYPVVDTPFRFDYRLKGYRVQIRSIDLNQPWQGIHRDMLALLD